MVQNPPFSGVQCWNPDRISVVINKEAVSVDRANFLATHAPLDHIRYERTPRMMDDTGEIGLLESLLDSEARDEHAFVVVRGIPGTGKSHLIRWLKERYEAAQASQGGHDVVLLIERAQCTLRGSIEQIIRSGVFDDTHMRRQLEQLQGAASALSKQALADSVLSQLHVAVTNELDSPTVPRPRAQLAQNLGDFLLDRTVREYFKRKGGPVDRIVRYLAYDRDAAMAANETPEFTASDFDLPVAVIHTLSMQGYQTVRGLAKSLQEREEWRAELATYLNRLLNTAVGRLTSLTADDLKSMFSELRRQLRQQGRGLALFIEDITAFTGIDRGLVDVLATQHTGVANQQFCRMLSVIGVTDSYYHDSFPDNIKERVSMQLSLNAESDDAAIGAREADLLRDADAIADLTGRYLNAMRLTQEELDDWLAQGAAPERLPNACARCQYQRTCHPAFGATHAHPGETQQPIGLYPFNERALTTLYQGLKGTTLTPRSFLNDVLAYVLLSYGDRIRRKEFPPSPAELQSRFSVPRLSSPGHFMTIEAQAGSQRSAGRVEALLRLWGNRTAYSVDVGGDTRLLGGLTEEVFTAFQAPFVAGEPVEVASGVVSDAPSRNGATQDANAKGERGTTGQGQERGLVPEVLTPDSPPVTRVLPPEPRDGTVGEPQKRPRNPRVASLLDELESWRQGGWLTSHDEFARRVATFLRTAIAWDAYDITGDVLTERLQNQRLTFEGQSAQRRVADYIEFPRTSETVSVLLALLQLSETYDSEAPAVNAGHMTRLGAWLRAWEPDIVAFVTGAGAQAGSRSANHMTGLDASLLTAATFAALSGALDRSCDTPESLLEVILAQAVNPPKLDELETIAKGVRSATWVDALKAAALTRDNWRQLLAQLNRPQGRGADSSEAGADENARRTVYFLNVAPALATLQRLLASDWTLPPRDGSGRGRASAANPGSPERAYDEVRTRFNTVMQEARQVFTVWKRDLDAIFGQSTAEEALNALSDLLDAFHRAQQGYESAFNQPPEAAVIEKARAGLESIVSAPSRTQLVLGLSSAAQTIKDTRIVVYFFTAKLAPFLTQKTAALESQLQELRGASATQSLTAEIEQEYGELEQILTNAMGSSVDPRATPTEAVRIQTGVEHE